MDAKRVDILRKERSGARRLLMCGHRENATETELSLTSDCRTAERTSLIEPRGSLLLTSDRRQAPNTLYYYISMWRKGFQPIDKNAI